MGIDNVDDLKPGENDEVLEEVPQPNHVSNVDSSSVEANLEADADDAAHLEDTADPVRTHNVFEQHEDMSEREEPGDSLEKVARQVLDGKWGVGQMRRMSLQDAGYDPNAVEEAVKQLLNPQPQEEQQSVVDPDEYDDIVG